MSSETDTSDLKTSDSTEVPLNFDPKKSLLLITNVKLTDEQKDFLNALQEEFKDRYTEKDEDYKAALEAKVSPPPVYENWLGHNYGRYHQGNSYSRHHYRDRHGREEHNHYRERSYGHRYSPHKYNSHHYHHNNYPY